jgi:predicted amidophosphoribosyltransferase
MPKLHESITQDRIADLIDRAESTLDSPGLCVACGADAEDVEPDAAASICECCGQPAVYGVELIAIMTF